MGSLTASLSVSSPSSNMGCVRSVGYCRGDDERLDLLELARLAVSGVKNVESAVGLLAARGGLEVVAVVVVVVEEEEEEELEMEAEEDEAG